MESGKRDNNLSRDPEEAKQKSGILFPARSRPTDKQHSWLKAIEPATRSQEAADRPDRHLEPKTTKYFEGKLAPNSGNNKLRTARASESVYR